MRVVRTTEYRGRGRLLVLFGVGAPLHAPARRAHVRAGGVVLHFDLGYFGRQKEDGYLRMSINDDHPQRWLSRTPADPSRWRTLGLQLREDWDAGGHVILVGLGRKSRSYLHAQDWEAAKLRQLQVRFPGRRIVYRPKGRDFPVLPCECDSDTPIAHLLQRASLVVCRHSNVAVDAALAGVPFEAEDGAAVWLAQRGFTPENRLDFLQRLAWWQWKASEARLAWDFAQRILTCD